MATRRLRGEGSIYQRESDGRWVGVIDLGRVGGKRVRRTVTANTKRELSPKFKALKAQVEKGVLTDETTVGQWMDHWLDNIAAERVAPSTLRTYRMYSERWIKPHLGHHRLDRLHQDHLRALYATMREAGKADNTRHHVHSILRRALKVAERDGRVHYNPAERVDPPPLGKDTHGKLTLEEARLVLKVAAERPDTARWAVALLAGLRQGEALGLRWEDVDLDAGLLRIERAAQRIPGKGMQLVPVKSASGHRYVPMVLPVRAALAAMTPTDGFVFGTDKPADPKTDWQTWQELLDAAGVPRRPLHAARATTASLLHEAKVPAKVIAEILGHAQVDVTFRSYISGDSRQHMDAMAAVDRLLEG